MTAVGGPILAALLLALLAAAPALPAETELQALVASSTAHNPGKTGVFILEKGEHALLARGWLADHAARSIEVQYFIWTADNVGILASEALLRAADRGVQVRVLVDDLLIHAPGETLLALAAHPKIDIRVYNPRLNVGVSRLRALVNSARDFRGANQRMHDKTFIVDGGVCITGGRNMADEYFDYDQEYNFRDRDALLIGPAAGQARESFETFWSDPLAKPIETLLPEAPPSPERTRAIYEELHGYAAKPENFAPEVRAAMAELPRALPEILKAARWAPARFVSDRPGKNAGAAGLAGGGRSTSALSEMARAAKSRVTIQSPYLVLHDEALALFRELVARGVSVRVVTNSLAATDNLRAYSGYHKRRRRLLEAGIEIREFRPDPAVRAALMREARFPGRPPVFAIHAKTMVIDGQVLFVGTYNLDPRSANLNTEVGVQVDDPVLAAQAERAIEEDMRPENSWDAARPSDGAAPWRKRLELFFWKLLPLDPLL